MIHFQGNCTYTLSQSKNSSSLPDFAVRVDNEHRNGVMKVSFTAAVEIEFGNDKVRIEENGRVTVSSFYLVG